MKYTQEIQGFLTTEVHPLLKESTPLVFLQNNIELIKRIRSFIPNTETDQKLLWWLGGQKKKITGKLKVITSQNHVKITKTKKTTLQKKISKTKPTLEISDTGEVLKVHNIKEEEQKEEKTYSKIEVVFKSPYGRRREANIISRIKTYEESRKLMLSQHMKLMAKANRKIDEIEKDVKRISPSIQKSIDIQTSTLNDLVDSLIIRKKAGEIIDIKEYEAISKLRDSMLNTYKDFSRAKTGVLYHMANSLFPIREKMINELKGLQEMEMKDDMNYQKLAELDEVLLEKSSFGSENILSIKKELNENPELKDEFDNFVIDRQ